MGTKAVKKVLVVEDDLALLDILDRTISDRGYRVIKATDGQKGLALALKNTPDLILLDLELPLLNGKDLLKLVRKNEQIKATPIVILTNDSSYESMENMSRNAAPAYFIKSETSLVTIAEAIELHLSRIA